MTVNHEMPGPSINVCKDDRIIVDVTNNMAGEEVTMHWHGLHQNDTPWFDGVPMVRALNSQNLEFKFYLKKYFFETSR